MRLDHETELLARLLHGPHDEQRIAAEIEEVVLGVNVRGIESEKVRPDLSKLSFKRNIAGGRNGVRTGRARCVARSRVWISRAHPGSHAGAILARRRQKLSQSGLGIGYSALDQSQKPFFE